MPNHKSQFAWVITALALALLLPAGGCNALEFMPLATAERRLSEDFQTSNAPTIVIETFNGAIDVSRGGDNQVQVDVVKRASGIDRAAAEAALDLVQVSMIQKGDSLVITAEMVESRPGNFGASIVIAVPAGAQLKMRTSNGHVVCEQVTGKIAARSSNGKIEIIDGQGELELATSNGAIEIDATDAVVDARTSNGRVEFSGSLADGAQQFKTSNGRIELTLPDDAQFAFDGHTSHSRIRSDFSVNTDNGRSRSRDLEGVVGDDRDPKCKISATSSNGSIVLRKASEADND
ncbi:MAG: DUF4097 family beta strand repeat-containing protein [Pirellulales bacterium]